MRDIDVPALRRDLEQSVEGEVRFTDGDRALYTTDASNYRAIPIGVVVPKTVAAIAATVRACARRGAPITHRGGGTALAGQSANTAVIIDSSKVGTEGTCASILRATVNLRPEPAFRSLVVAGFSSICEAADLVPGITRFGPLGCEGFDQRLADFMHKKRLKLDNLKLLPEGCGWMLIPFGAATQGEADERARGLLAWLSSQPGYVAAECYSDPGAQRKVWEAREAGLGATAFVPGQRDTWPGWEDSAMAPERLGTYLRDLLELYERYGYYAYRPQLRARDAALRGCRPMPPVPGRDHVSQLPRHPRGETLHARACPPAAGDVGRRPADERLGLGCGTRGPGSLSRLQGLPQRVSGAGGHGHLQGRVHVSLLSRQAALGAARRSRSRPGERADGRACPGRPRQVGRRYPPGPSAPSLRHAFSQGLVAPPGGRQQWTAGDSVLGHLQRLFHTGAPACRGRGPRGRWLPGRAARARGLLRPAIVRLRLPRRGAGQSRQRRTAPPRPALSEGLAGRHRGGVPRHLQGRAAELLPR